MSLPVAVAAGVPKLSYSSLNCNRALIRQDNQLKFQDYRFSVAPMMDWTDRHCRVFHRLMTRRGKLYTEMLTTGAILRGDRQRLLGFDPTEHPVALQFGGSNARDLATAAQIGQISATTKSISMSVVPRTGCRTAVLAPV